MRTSASDRQSEVGGVDLLGLAALFVGVVLVVLSFVTLPWYSVSGGPDSAGEGFTFTDLHANSDQLVVPVAEAYFHTLGWTVLAVLTLVGVLARVPSPVSDALRVAGFLLGFMGVALTYYAVAELFDAQQIAGGSAHGVLHNAAGGLWFAFGGYFLAGLGTVIGRRRPRGGSAPRSVRTGRHHTTGTL